jgi:hypothetical protein
MEQENEKYGNLFGTIDLLSEDHLELILNTMDKDHALYYIIESVKMAHSKGVFSIGESEVLSKSIRTLIK